jgi:hypothetical protein
MKARHSRTFALLVGAALLLAPIAQANPDLHTGSKPLAPKSVLFIGNSFTYYNNSLHMHLRNLVKSGFPKLTKELHFKAMTISGAYLANHALGAQGMIERYEHPNNDGPWDVVVLQGYSRGPIQDKTAESFRASATQLDASIRRAGSQTVLFMTWAYKDQPEMTAPLDLAYTKMGSALGALVVPVGLAFELARQQHPGMELYTEDLKHPSLLGTYLAANVFYATLYGESPIGSSYTAGLSPEKAAFAQRVAWQVSQSYQRRSQR